MLLKNVLNNVCTFLMKLFPSKFSCLFLRLSNNQNWLESIKSNITKTICFLKKTYTHIFNGYVKEHIFKIMKQNLITFLSWSSWKSRAYFLNIFWTKIRAMPLTMSFDIYMKWKLDYSIFVWHIQFFIASLEIQANQGNTHELQKVVLALKLR